MTDLHTHILPGMDDGAPDAEASLAMLREEAAQGVDTVALTPHFYRDREEPGHFLSRRARAWEQLNERLSSLSEAQRAALPQTALGAEVAWVPNLGAMPELSRLCLGESRYFLLELPFYPWDAQLLRQLYELPDRTGLTPVLAHLERYFRVQKREHLEEILSMDFPVQVSAAPLLRLTQRALPLRMLASGQAQLIASDAHNMTARAPDLGPAMQLIAKKLGAQRAEAAGAFADALLRPA